MVVRSSKETRDIQGRVSWLSDSTIRLLRDLICIPLRKPQSNPIFRVSKDDSRLPATGKKKIMKFRLSFHSSQWKEYSNNKISPENLSLQQGNYEKHLLLFSLGRVMGDCGD